MNITAMAMINIIWLPPNGPLIQQNVGYFWGWCAQALDYTGLQTQPRGCVRGPKWANYYRGRFWPCVAAVAKRQ